MQKIIGNRQTTQDTEFLIRDPRIESIFQRLPDFGIRFFALCQGVDDPQRLNQTVAEFRRDLSVEIIDWPHGLPCLLTLFLGQCLIRDHHIARRFDVPGSHITGAVIIGDETTFGHNDDSKNQAEKKQENPVLLRLGQYNRNAKKIKSILFRSG